MSEKPLKVKLEENRLAKLDEGLFARKTSEGEVEIYEVIERRRKADEGRVEVDR